jgi:hypothetical protein
LRFLVERGLVFGKETPAATGSTAVLVGTDAAPGNA